MRSTYIPSSEVYVFERESMVVGFYAFDGDTLSALFVSPESQGQAVGTQLMAHAKRTRSSLTLSVYKENSRSCQFYILQGFTITEKSIDQHTGHEEFVLSLDPE